MTVFDAYIPKIDEIRKRKRVHLVLSSIIMAKSQYLDGLR
ncbi:hypothetical protein M2277_002029 [Paenibacillus sp. LBL]|nr:hypothetical protein [Paenibacillus sp. LBL]